jgi:hypothetical protein
MNKFNIVAIQAYVNLFYKYIKIDKDILHNYIINCGSINCNFYSENIERWTGNYYNVIVLQNKLVNIIERQSLSEETCLYLISNYKYNKEIIHAIFKYQIFKISTKLLIYINYYNNFNTSVKYLDICFYLGNNICSTEQYIDLLKYDIEIFQFIKNPPQEVKDFYDLASI